MSKKLWNQIWGYMLFNWFVIEKVLGGYWCRSQYTLIIIKSYNKQNKTTNKGWYMISVLVNTCLKELGCRVKSIALSYVTVTIYKMSKINKWQVCTLIVCELNVLGIKTMLFMVVLS